MFLVNSRLGLGLATPQRFSREGEARQGVPLLPKVRGQFAEFLDKGSLDRLGILYLPTSVGLRYGHHTICTARGFSRQWGIDDSSAPEERLGPVLTVDPGDFPPGRGYNGPRTMSIRPARIYPPASPHRSSVVATEYKPFVHRLRLSASA